MQFLCQCVLQYCFYCVKLYTIDIFIFLSIMLIRFYICLIYVFYTKNNVYENIKYNILSSWMEYNYNKRTILKTAFILLLFHVPLKQIMFIFQGIVNATYYGCIINYLFWGGCLWEHAFTE